MLRPLPFTTFSEIAALQLEAHVYCSRCYAMRRFDPSANDVRDRCFAGTRFWSRRCDTPGQLQIRPPELLPLGGAVRLAFLWCKSCVFMGRRGAWPSHQACGTSRSRDSG